MDAFQLAQVNIGRPKGPTDGPVMADFMAVLEPVNANADAAPGFVWRLQTEAGDATDLRVFDDSLMVNMSVWESVEALRAFVYTDPAHLAIMRRRREFFEQIGTFQALWWIPAGTVPSIADAEERLTLLRAVGPSPDAFTFRRHFPPPGGSGSAVDDDRGLCPA